MGQDLTDQERGRLDRLGSLSGYFLFTSPVAPLLAMLLILGSGGDNTQAAIVVLVLVALAGFATAYGLYQKILADLAALRVVTHFDARDEEATQTLSSVASKTERIGKTS